MASVGNRKGKANHNADYASDNENPAENGCAHLASKPSLPVVPARPRLSPDVNEVEKQNEGDADRVNHHAASSKF